MIGHDVDSRVEVMENTSQHVTTILVVDDHVLFRQGLVSLLGSQPDFKIVGEASNIQEALSKVQELKPNLVLLDISLPDGSGLEIIRTILSQSPATQVVLLTVYESDDFMFIALGSGAKGYIHKSTPFTGLLAALRGLLRGEAAVSRSMTNRILEEYSRMMSVIDNGPALPATGALSRRELEVLQALGAEASNKEIAERLFITENTVKIHVHNILNKLNLPNRHEAAKFARRKGFGSLPPDPPKSAREED